MGSVRKGGRGDLRAIVLRDSSAVVWVLWM